jgi:hypothetical protein
MPCAESPRGLTGKNQDQNQACHAQQGKAVASEPHESFMEAFVQRNPFEFVGHIVPLRPWQDHALSVVCSEVWVDGWAVTTSADHLGQRLRFDGRTDLSCSERCLILKDKSILNRISKYFYISKQVF